MPANKIPLTVILPVKNEGHQIARALKSVQWADEIIVIDSHSTDNTESTAKENGAQIIQFDFNGVWPKKRNWALTNIPIKNEWVLFLDADETLPIEAAEEISIIVKNPNPIYNGYWINRRFLFMDKWLEHAYFPNWVLRLFRHQLGRYQCITSGETTSGDNEVHEPLIVEGKTGYLQTMMNHYAFPTIDSFVERHNRYSNWEARVALTPSQPTDEPIKNWRFRLKIFLKRLFLYLPFRPTLRFLYVYIYQKGFLDGREGYYFAKLHGFYEFLNVAKTYELKKSLDQKKLFEKKPQS